MQNHRQQVRLPVALLAALSLAGALAGCERAAVSAPAAAAAPSYELVTVRRPLSLADHVAKEKAGYDLCVAAAELEKLPVEPFVALPADFVMERMTRLSDGKAYLMKQLQYGIDTGAMRPEQGCATSVMEVGVIERVRNGSLEHIDIDQDGKRVAAEPMRLAPAARVDGDSAAYSVARTERGVALLCIPAGAPGLVPGVVSEQCIVDAGSGRSLREPDGSLVVAYLREELSGRAGGSASVLEPLSFTLGPVDSAKLHGALK